MHVEIPAERLEEADKLASILGDGFIAKYPTLPEVRPVTKDLRELILNRTWRPALSIIGVEGIPPLGSAGNVLRPTTAVKLSMRIPPLVDAAKATARLRQIIEADPPYGAHVRFEPDHEADGWNAPATERWLREAIDQASLAYFGREAAYMGEGGTIPFMAMLGEKFPAAQFLITGLLGPGANAHGPNEFLHIPTAKKLTSSVASIIAAHAIRQSSKTARRD